MEKETIIAIVVSVFGSTGFWAFITAVWQSKTKKKSAESRMLKGIGHDRICELGERYLNQGYITKDQYENLHDYLFIPYRDLGGNGTAEKIVDDVKKLPIKGVNENENTGQVVQHS